jgi:hypothetical protein
MIRIDGELQAEGQMPNTVFILGAGASSEAGAPLMPQFINAARDLPGADRGAIRSVLDATAALAHSQAKATINLQNVEEIFSAFELAALVGAWAISSPMTLRRYPAR